MGASVLFVLAVVCASCNASINAAPDPEETVKVAYDVVETSLFTSGPNSAAKIQAAAALEALMQANGFNERLFPSKVFERSGVPHSQTGKVKAELELEAQAYYDKAVATIQGTDIKPLLPDEPLQISLTCSFGIANKPYVIKLTALLPVLAPTNWSTAAAASPIKSFVFVNDTQAELVLADNSKKTVSYTHRSAQYVAMVDDAGGRMLFTFVSGRELSLYSYLGTQLNPRFSFTKGS